MACLQSWYEKRTDAYERDGSLSEQTWLLGTILGCLTLVFGKLTNADKIPWRAETWWCCCLYPLESCSRVKPVRRVGAKTLLQPIPPRYYTSGLYQQPLHPQRHGLPRLVAVGCLFWFTFNEASWKFNRYTVNPMPSGKTEARVP